MLFCPAIIPILLYLNDDAFMIYLEENFEDAPNVFNLFARSGGSNAPASTDEGAQRLNQRQTKIVNEIPNDISGAYFGNSEGYTRMLKNFKREMIERSRIKVDFETGLAYSKFEFDKSKKVYDDLKNSHFVGKATGVTNTSEIQLMNVGMACLLTIKKNLKEEN